MLYNDNNSCHDMMVDYIYEEPEQCQKSLLSFQSTCTMFIYYKTQHTVVNSKSVVR